MKFQRFSEAENHIYSLIKNKIDTGYRAGFALERVKYALSLLDNPQEKVKTIHIAGTSGKGSTAKFIHDILLGHGFNTGLTISPHLVDIRERIQLNGQLITKQDFTSVLNDIYPWLIELEETHFGKLTYFEVLIVMAYCYFYKMGVDYAVVETGLGGLYDATNSISNKSKYNVITRIGFDHMHLLGNTLEEIALNKAGIINRLQAAITVNSDMPIKRVLKGRAQEMNSKIKFIGEDDYLSIPGIRKYVDHLPEYQRENLSLALQCCREISIRDNWKLNIDIVKKVIGSYKFEGRFEHIKYKGADFLLDGAHNPQKMAAFIESLWKKYERKDFTFILAFKEDKDISSMIKQISKYTNQLIVTQFTTTSQDFNHKSFNSSELSELITKISGKTACVFSKPIEAINHAIEATKDYPIVVTGSLYLVGEVRQIVSSSKPQQYRK